MMRLIRFWEFAGYVTLPGASGILVVIFLCTLPISGLHAQVDGGVPDDGIVAPPLLVNGDGGCPDDSLRWIHEILMDRDNDDRTVAINKLHDVIRNRCDCLSTTDLGVLLAKGDLDDYIRFDLVNALQFRWDSAAVPYLLLANGTGKSELTNTVIGEAIKRYGIYTDDYFYEMKEIFLSAYLGINLSESIWHYSVAAGVQTRKQYIADLDLEYHSDGRTDASFLSSKHTVYFGGPNITLGYAQDRYVRIVENYLFFTYGVLAEFFVMSPNTWNRAETEACISFRPSIGVAWRDYVNVRYSLGPVYLVSGEYYTARSAVTFQVTLVAIGF